MAKPPKSTPELEETDENGVRWTPTSHTLPSGEGETYGPGHPNRPAKTVELAEKQKAKEPT